MSHLKPPQLNLPEFMRQSFTLKVQMPKELITLFKRLPMIFQVSYFIALLEFRIPYRVSAFFNRILRELIH